MVTKNYHQNEARKFCIQLNSIISILRRCLLSFLLLPFQDSGGVTNLTTINILSDGAIEFPCKRY